MTKRAVPGPGTRPWRAGTRARRSGAPHLLLLVIATLFFSACSDPPPTIESVRALQAAGDFEGSLAPLRALLADAPDEPETNFLYGRALLRTGAPDRAIWAMRKAAAAPEWAVPAGIALGRAALAAREWDNAIEVADGLLERDPDAIDARLIRADALIESKREYERALADIDHVLALAPDHLPARADRVAALIALERVDEAAEALRALEEMDALEKAEPEFRARICTIGALFAADGGEAEAADERFRRCVADHPRSSTVLEQYIGFLDGQQRVEEANQLLSDALERSPDDPGLRVSLARRLIALGRIDEARSLLEAGTQRRHPVVAANAWAALADVEVASGDLDAAAAAYEQSLAGIDTPSDFQLLTLADVLARAGQDERALEVAGRIENDAYAGLIEARVHMNRGEPEQALDRLDEVLPRWPNNPGARYWAARASEQLGRFDRAVEEYRQAIRSNPTFTDAAVRLARLLVAQGDHEPAWSAIGTYANERPGDVEAGRLMMRIASAVGPEPRLRGLVQRLAGGPSWPSAVAERARQAERAGGPDAAIRTLRESSGLDLTRPANAPALEALVDVLVRADRAEEALAATEAATWAHAGVARFLAAHGRALLAAGQPEAARRAVEAAVAADPQEPSVHTARARVEVAGGHLDAALAAWAEARRLDPDAIDAYVEPARALEEAERNEEALAIWRALARERPDQPVAALAIARRTWERARDTRDESQAREALDWAGRAARFGGGEVAQRLRIAILRSLGETRRADELEARLDATPSATG